MTEDRKHQLDELSVTDILGYLGARASDMEEQIRRSEKQSTIAELRNRNQELLKSCEGATMMYKELQKATELLKWSLHSDPEHDEDFDQKWEEAEQFLQGHNISDDGVPSVSPKLDTVGLLLKNISEKTDELKRFIALWEQAVCEIRAENKAGSDNARISHLCDKLESSMTAYAKGDIEYAHFAI